MVSVILYAEPFPNSSEQQWPTQRLVDFPDCFLPSGPEIRLSETKAGSSAALRLGSGCRGLANQLSLLCAHGDSPGLALQTAHTRCW